MCTYICMQFTYILPNDIKFAGMVNGNDGNIESTGKEWAMR